MSSPSHVRITLSLNPLFKKYFLYLLQPIPTYSSAANCSPYTESGAWAIVKPGLIQLNSNSWAPEKIFLNACQLPSQHNTQGKTDRMSASWKKVKEPCTRGKLLLQEGNLIRCIIIVWEHLILHLWGKGMLLCWWNISRWRTENRKVFTLMMMIIMGNEEWIRYAHFTGLGSMGKSDSECDMMTWNICLDGKIVEYGFES